MKRLLSSAMFVAATVGLLACPAPPPPQPPPPSFEPSADCVSMSFDNQSLRGAEVVLKVALQDWAPGPVVLDHEMWLKKDPLVSGVVQGEESGTRDDGARLVTFRIPFEYSQEFVESLTPGRPGGPGNVRCKGELRPVDASPGEGLSMGKGMALPIPGAPGLRMVTIQVSRLGRAAGSFVAELGVMNPNFFPFEIERMSFTTLMGPDPGTEVHRDQLEEQVVVEPGQELMFETRFDVGDKADGPSLDSLVADKAVSYRVEGTLTLVDGPEFPFVVEGEVTILWR